MTTLDTAAVIILTVFIAEVVYLFWHDPGAPPPTPLTVQAARACLKIASMLGIRAG